MRRLIGKFFLALFPALLFFCSLALLQPTAAQDFTNSYKVEYFLQSNETSLRSRVVFLVTITNLRSDIIVKKMNLTFPKTFVIRNVSATDNNGAIKTEVVTDAHRTTIQMEVPNPAVGKDATNTIRLEFEQENLFKMNGNVWEVILPTTEDKASTSYQITVHLPLDTNKKISIAKPKPDRIEGAKIIWDNPKVKTIYAVFGDKQYYNTKLTYHIQNPKVVPVFTDVAFPPDTQYQKVYVNTIQPKPAQTHIDEDGNFMGRYLLKPREKLDILFDSTIEVMTKPRMDMHGFIQKQFETQKSYLLTQKDHWKLPTPAGLESLKTPYDVHRYITQKFSYNYDRVNKSIKRLGAMLALQNPDQVVCVEFSDSFVAISREKGIYSREIEGYGFSNDPQLRPLSLISDVLHSWPEYYNQSSGLWIPIDPTWEDTSGIDYFTSFDLNHVTFVIHGKNTEYPLAAGMYKFEDTRDISILPTSQLPEEKISVKLESFAVPSQIADNQTYKAKITLINNSNVYVFDVPIEVQANNLTIVQPKQLVAALAPYEKKEIAVEYTAKTKNQKTNSAISLSIFGNKVYLANVTIVPYYYEIALKVAYGLIGVSGVILLLKLLKSLRRRHR